MTHSTADGPAKKPSQLREGYRVAMHRALLDTALELVAAEGEEALTIKRLAQDFGSSIGTIYRFFPSKEALVAAIRADQLEELVSAATAAAAHVDRALQANEEPGSVAALTRVLGASRFWIDAARRSRHEVGRVLQQVGRSGDDVTAADRESDRVLAPLTQALEEAVATEALAEGHSTARAALIVSIVPLPDDVDRLGGDHGGGSELGNHLLECLLTSWGAAQAPLARAGVLAHAALDS